MYIHYFSIYSSCFSNSNQSIQFRVFRSNIHSGIFCVWWMKIAVVLFEHKKHYGGSHCSCKYTLYQNLTRSINLRWVNNRNIELSVVLFRTDCSKKESNTRFSIGKLFIKQFFFYCYTYTYIGNGEQRIYHILFPWNHPFSLYVIASIRITYLLMRKLGFVKSMCKVCVILAIQIT